MGIGLWLHLVERHDHDHVHESLDHAHAHVHDAHHQHTHGQDDPPGEPHVHAHRHRPLVHSHPRSEEHTSELQSLMRTSYAVFCLKKNTDQKKNERCTITVSNTQ